MSENIIHLIDVVKHIQKQQFILTKMLIHIGFRSDLYDDFIQDCFVELENLNNPKLKESDK